MITTSTLKICLSLMLSTDTETQQADKELLLNDKLNQTTFSQCVQSYGEEIKTTDDIFKPKVLKRIGPGGGIDQPAPLAF